MDLDQNEDLLSMQWRSGARGEGGRIDCLGVVIELARRRGRPLQDPWQRAGELQSAGLPVDHLFSPGWCKVSGPPADDDVLLFGAGAGELGVGYVLGGHLWSASRRRGPFRLPLHRLHWDELWRWAP